MVATRPKALKERTGAGGRSAVEPAPHIPHPQHPQTIAL